MIKKFILSSLVLGIFIVYTVHNKLGGDYNSKPVVIRTSVPSALPQTTPVSSGVIRNGSKYKDGTFTGSVADAFYGNIQVQVVISGGKISDVIFLQYPNDRGTSIEINSQAMPLLKQEVIQAQSAQVDGVSGATASSGAFIQSLQNALSQAV